MSYSLSEVTIRTNNSIEGVKKIDELWKDIATGKIPLLFDNENNFQEGISPISRYSNYESDEKGYYNLSIVAVKSDFFANLEQEVERGKYIKYVEINDNGNIATCTQDAWKKVWDDYNSGKLDRSFIIDYESTVPAEYTKDGKAHCYLYIAVK